MRCLSISQPFAQLIILGKKTIELRNWNTNYRGIFLIHSPQKIRFDDCKRLKMSTNLISGAIIARAEIYDVKIYRNKTELKLDYQKHLANIEFKNKKYGFMIKNVKPFRFPIPYKGKLGFFDVRLPKFKMSDSEIESDIIDEEYRYQWIGHH